MTREKLKKEDLRPNRALKESIEQWKTLHPNFLQRAPRVPTLVYEEKEGAPKIIVTANGEFEGVLIDENIQTQHVVLEVSTLGMPGVEQRPAMDICVLLDISGSMEGSKLANSKTAINFLIDSLLREDQISLVVYDDKVEELFRGKNIAEKDHLKQLVDAIRTRGSTNIGAGLIGGAQALGITPCGKYFNVKNAKERDVKLAEIRFTAEKTDEPLTMGESTTKPEEIKQHWKWKVMCETAAGALEIETCEYELHPSFQPCHIVCAKGEVLERVGWGIFNIKGKVNFVDGSYAEFTLPMKFSGYGVTVTVTEQDRKGKVLPEFKVGDEVQRIKRIFLFSDGQANTGLQTVSELGELAEEISLQGCSISSLGLGDDYSEDVMQAIANKGHGEMTHVKHAHHIDQYMKDAFATLCTTIGTDTRLYVEGKNGAKIKRVLMKEMGVIQLHDIRCNDSVFIVAEIQFKTNGMEEMRIDCLDYELSFLPVGQSEREAKKGSLNLLFTKSKDVASTRQKKPRSTVLQLKAAELDREVTALIDAKKRKEAIAKKEEVIKLLEEAKELNPEGTAAAFLKADIKTLEIMKSKDSDAAIRKANAYSGYSKGGCSNRMASKMSYYADEDD